MPRIVRGALVQATWTGDKESMIQKHEQRAHDAKAQGAQLVLFQELFYGPYFCQVQDPQYYAYMELIPDGPTTKRMQALAKELGVVLGVPVYEEDSQASGVCYDRHFPEGARALGLNGAEIVLIPSATSRVLSEYLWRIEQPSHAVANGYYVGTINRVVIESEISDDDFYGQSYFVNPRGQFIGELGSAHDEELIVRDMDLDLITEVRQTWQFFRDRRPDAYADLTRP